MAESGMAFSSESVIKRNINEIMKILKMKAAASAAIVI